MRKNNTVRLTLSAALMAIYVVLSYISIPTEFIKFSFASFAVYVGAFLFGPIQGFLIGFLAEGIVQWLRYGLEAMTVLWMLPVGIRGLLAGWYAMRHKYSLSILQQILCVLLTGLFVTALNTGFLYLRGIIYGYAVLYTVLQIALRFVSSIVMTAIYCLLLPKCIALIRRALP